MHNRSALLRPRRSARLTWVLAAACAACLATGCSMASQGMNAEGARLHQQGNYQGALQSFQKSISKDPNNPDGYYNVAATLHRLGKLNGDQTMFKQAEDYYNLCLDRDDNHTECYRGLAVLLAETGRADRAAVLLEGWSTRSPSNADAKIELARLQEEYGNQELATQRLVEALNIDPNNTRALTALARLREQAGNHYQASQLYERSLSVNRFQPQVASRLAAIQNAIGIHPNTTSPGETRVVQEPLQWNRY